MDPVSVDTGKKVVVELPLHSVGIPSVKNELADTRNGSSTDKERFAVLLEDVTDIALNAGKLLSLTGVGKALACGVDHGYSDSHMVPVAFDASELAISSVSAHNHRFSEGILPFAFRPPFRHGKFLRVEGLFS